MRRQPSRNANSLPQESKETTSISNSNAGSVTTIRKEAIPDAHAGSLQSLFGLPPAGSEEKQGWGRWEGSQAPPSPPTGPRAGTRGERPPAPAANLPWPAPLPRTPGQLGAAGPSPILEHGLSEPPGPRGARPWDFHSARQLGREGDATVSIGPWRFSAVASDCDADTPEVGDEKRDDFAAAAAAAAAPNGYDDGSVSANDRRPPRPGTEQEWGSNSGGGGNGAGGSGVIGDAPARPRFSSTGSASLGTSAHAARNAVLEARMITTRSFRQHGRCSAAASDAVQQPSSRDAAVVFHSNGGGGGGGGGTPRRPGATPGSHTTTPGRSQGKQQALGNGSVHSDDGSVNESISMSANGSIAPWVSPLGESRKGKAPQLSPPGTGDDNAQPKPQAGMATPGAAAATAGAAVGAAGGAATATGAGGQEPPPPPPPQGLQDRQRTARYLKNMAKAKALERRGLTSSMPLTGEFGSHALGAGTKLRRSVLLLLLVGVVAGPAAHAVKVGISAMHGLRDDELLPLAEGGLRFLLYWSYMAAGTSLAVLLTAGVAPEAAGSGIPIMKYLMGTDNVRIKSDEQFSLRGLLVKCLGLTLAAGSGLNIGREGPFTHVAGMVASLFMRHFPMFEQIYNVEALLRAALAAAVAVGVSTTFAATIGGVLFSIEVTSTYYRVDNYFKGFVAAIGGAVAVQLLRRVLAGATEAKDALNPTNFTIDSYRFYEYPLFCALGAAMGMLGPLYVHTRLFFMSRLRRYSGWHMRQKPGRRAEFLWRAVGVGAGVATVTSVLSFVPGEYTRDGPFQAFSALLTTGSLGSDWSGVPGGIWVSLPISAAVRAVTAALGTAIVAPAGDFILTVVIGASLGRLTGELVRLGDASAVPATYALLGGAALAGGATQTISAGVIMMEFTGAFVLSGPILVTTIVACGVSYSFGLNIYDSIIRLNGLPWLPGLKPQHRAETQTARDIMVGADHLCFLTAEPTVGEILRLLEDRGRRLESYPVVSSREAMAFLGTIHRQDLARVVEREARREQNLLERLKERLPDDLGTGRDTGGPSRTWVNTISRLVQSTTRTIGRTWGADKGEDGGNGNSYGNSNGRTNGNGNGRSGGGTGISLSALFDSPPAAGRTPTGEYRRSVNGQRLNLMTLQAGGWDPARMEADATAAFESRTVNLLTLFADDEVSIDTSPWSVPEGQALGNLHVLFELLRIPRLFVVSGGQLTGVITRQTLTEALLRPHSAAGGGDGSGHSGGGTGASHWRLRELVGPLHLPRTLPRSGSSVRGSTRRPGSARNFGVMDEESNDGGSRHHNRSSRGSVTDNSRHSSVAQ